MRLLKCFLKNLNFFFALKKLKKTPSKAEFWSFQKFSIIQPNSPKGRIHVQNVAYRATVYRTGGLGNKLVKGV